MILFIDVSFSQNLVLNPSFEDTVSCPNNLDQINRAIGWSSYRESPDYFNSCSSSGNISGVPLNIMDFQIPRTGFSYAGFATILTTAVNYREYIGVSLSHPLTVGQNYFVSFFVSRVCNTTQHKNISTNKIGALFSTVQYSFSNPAPINNFCQVYTDSIITDTLNWTKIDGVFTADSAYSFICIGNFYDDTLTSIYKIDSTDIASYYFIDDISVVEFINENVSESDIDNLLTFYPNPCKDFLLIRSKIFCSISVKDIVGKTISTNIIEPFSTFNYDTSTFSKGLYLITVQNIKINNTIKFLVN